MDKHKIYGISQNPDTKDYILVFCNGYFNNHCEECCKMYTDAHVKWCRPCRVNYLKNNFSSWTSENEQIDDLIKEKQLNISSSYDKVCEWISYKQFYDIKKLNNNDF